MIRNALIQAIILAVAAFPALASTILIMGSVEGLPGQKVSIPVSLTTMPGVAITGVGADISYDAGMLEISEVAIGPAAIKAGKEMLKSGPAKGLLRLALLGFSKQENIGDGTIAILRFTIKPDALPGRTPINISPSAVDREGNTLPMDGANGSVFVIRQRPQ